VPGYDFKKLNEKTAGVLKYFEAEISGLRTGRATPALLENVKVDAYGVMNVLKNIASIISEDAKTLLVQPWDKGLLDAISKAIEFSNLGVRPVAAKDSIRISFPPLTEERRKALAKVLKDKIEEARISLRQIRDEVWKDIQEKEKSKAISEDDKFRFKEEMEKKIKEVGDKLDALAAKKEKEIME